LRDFFTRSTPPFTRVLLIESGSRRLFDMLVPGLFDIYGDQLELDLVTCFAGTPQGFRGGAVYNVNDYRGRAEQKRLYRELSARNYLIAGIICSGEPILTKWKWVLAGGLKSKVFVLNENCDYFWIDYGHTRTMTHFMLFRMGLTGASAISTIARLIAFPFMLAYLILYAGFVHLRRKLRGRKLRTL
jgi:hypothetical protein